MNSPLLSRPRHRFIVSAAPTVGVLLLTPLIVLAGVVAVLALTALALSRRLAAGSRAGTAGKATAPVLRLEAAPIEPVLAVVGRRAA